MLILKQTQNIVLSYKANRQSNFRDGFEPFDCDQLFSRIASSFVDLTVGALSNPLEKRVSLEKLELFHNR